MTTQDYALTIEQYFVKNFWPGRDGYMPMAIVEHTMQGTLEETRRYFNREAGEYYVSAHYGIGQDGRIWQFVRDEDTAWANGVLQEPDTSIDWLKEVYEEGVNPNLITLTIEYEGYSGEPLTEAQYEAALQLHRRLLDRWEIPADSDHILGHDRFDSVERTLNPGPAFPWTRLLDDLKLGEASFKAETIVAGQAPEPEPLTLLNPSEAELEPLEPTSEASLIDQSAYNAQPNIPEVDEEELPITLDAIFHTSAPQAEPVEQLDLPEIEPIQARSYPEIVPFAQEGLSDPEIDEPPSLYEAELAEQANLAKAAKFEPSNLSETVELPAMYGKHLTGSEPFAVEESPTAEAAPPEGLSDLIFDFEEDLPSSLLDQPSAGASEVEQQLETEVTLAHEEAQEPAPLLPFEGTRVSRPEIAQSDAASEPEIAGAWALPEIFEEESHTQPELKEELPQFLMPEETPDVLDAFPAIQPEAASEPTVIAVPPRDPLEELDDLIFDEGLPPGVKEEQLPSLDEATSAKVDLPDFDDFDSLFDEISGLGDPVSKVEIKPFEIEGAPRSSAPVATPAPEKRAAPVAAPPPPPDDLTGLIEAPVGGGVVSVELANVRKRPSYDPNTVMRTAAKNTRYKFDGYTEGPELQGSTRWFHITHADGSGWIHSVLVQLDQPFTPAEFEK